MQLQKLSQQLQAIGLSDKQSKVYVASLFLGSGSAQKIAEQADLNRPTTYDVLEELAKMGLITRSIQNTKTVFIPAGGAALERLVAQQAEAVERRRRDLATLLPQLEAIERLEAASQPLVRFVRGKEGVDGIFAYALRKARPGSELLCMINLDEVLKVYPDYPHYNLSARLAKKISSKQFYSSGKRTTLSGPKFLKETLRLAEPIDADITLYEDKAVLLSYKDNWTGIIIESKDIVEMLRQLFHMAWKNKNKK